MILVLGLLITASGCSVLRSGVDLVLDSEEKLEEFLLESIDKAAENLKEEVPDLLDKGLNKIRAWTDDKDDDENPETSPEDSEQQ